MYYKISSSIRDVSPNHAYIGYCLITHSDVYKGTSCVKEQTLAELSHNSIDTVSDALKELEKAGVITINKQLLKGNKGCFTSNNYTIINQNYRFISNGLLNEEDTYLAGFVVQLWTLSLAGTLEIKMNMARIAEFFSKLGATAVRKYMNRAIKAGYIRKDGNKANPKYTFIREDLFKPCEISTYMKVKYFYPEVLTDDNINNKSAD